MKRTPVKNVPWRNAVGVTTALIPEDKSANRPYPEEVYKFDSVPALYRYVETNLETVRKGYWPSEDTLYSLMPMNATNTVSEALAMAARGWPEGVARMMDGLVDLERQFLAEAMRPESVMDVYGDEVDVPAFVTGLPESMARTEPGQTRTTAVHVTVDVNVRCDACGIRQHDAAPTDPTTVLLRGAAVTMLIKGLVMAGLTPTLSVYTTTHYSGDHFSCNHLAAKGTFLRTVWVDVVQPGVTPNYHHIAIALAHDSFVRRAEFALHEILNPPISSRIRHRGSPFIGELELGRSHQDYLRTSLPIGEIDIPSPARIIDSGTGGDEFENPKAAVSWVFATLKNVGVRFR